MKHLRVGALVLSLAAGGVVVSTAPASAAPAAGNQLVCFDGASEGAGNGVCKLVSKGAVLKNPGDGDYSGVYVPNDGLSGRPLSAVTNLSFHYTRDTAGGAPRFSLAIDTDAKGDWDIFAFADANGCGSAAPKSGVVNVISNGTPNPACQITTTDGGAFPDYAAFVAAYPGARYASTQVSFIIADQPGNYRLAQVRLNKPAAKGS